MSAPKNIELSIGELVLEGFPAGDRCRIAAGVQGELTRLLSEPGALSLGHDVERAQLHAGSFTVAHGTSAKTIGAQIARAVITGLKRS